MSIAEKIVQEGGKNLKVIFLAKETPSSLEALNFLTENPFEIIGAVIRKRDKGLLKICNEKGIPVYTEEELVKEIKKKGIETDWIFSFYWKKAKERILSLPKQGSINFHPGPLPEARGSGYHMAILEQWGYWGVTAHFMDEEFDTGNVIECCRFDIPEKIVNKDLVQLTHENLALLFRKTAQKILNGERLEAQRQGNGRYFSISDLEKEKYILEEESADQIDRKIRAFWNPPYSGAKIVLAGKEYTLVNEDVLNWIDEKLKDRQESL